MIGGLGIGAGANVVGGLMQSIAASQAAKKMGKEFQRELQRQQRYRNEAFGVAQERVGGKGVETARQQIGEGAQNRENFYEQTRQRPLGIGGGQTRRDRATYKLLGRNRANLGGYSDWALDQMIASIRAQDELNRISNFAGGTAQVFPYRMNEAQHSMDELAFWGQLISSLGGTAQQWGSAFGGAPPQAASPAGVAAPTYSLPLYDAPIGFGQQFAAQV